jgi:hypothetical protein
MTSLFDLYIKTISQFYEMTDHSGINENNIETEVWEEVWDIGLDYYGIKNLLNGSECSIPDIINPVTNSQLYNDHGWLLDNNNISIRTKKGLMLYGNAWARFSSLGGDEGTIYIDRVTLENIYESNNIDYFKQLKHYILHEVGHAVQAFQRDVMNNDKYWDIEDDYDANEEDAEEFAAMYLNNTNTY